MKRGTSRLKGFHRISAEERRAAIGEKLGLGQKRLFERIPQELVDKMVENSVGVFAVPLGVATNFRVNGSDVLVPMAVEEASVIAAASNAAKMARAGSGFLANAAQSLMIAQIEILDHRKDAGERIEEAQSELLSKANDSQKELLALGGGARAIEVRRSVGDPGRLVVHLAVDCLDAMGANMVNTMAETISGDVAALSGGRVGLRILSNLADRRLARAECEIPFEALARRGFEGRDVAAGIAAASRFASCDPYRAATHNKGIFNGIDAVLLATGNDWRAVEAGGHAFAARGGTYGPLATWEIRGKKLVGAIELPMAVGVVGGAAKAHPTARRCLEIMGVETAKELAEVVASAGLASNLAALAALSSEGIQPGHMRLHERKLGK